MWNCAECNIRGKRDLMKFCCGWLHRNMFEKLFIFQLLSYLLLNYLKHFSCSRCLVSMWDRWECYHWNILSQDKTKMIGPHVVPLTVFCLFDLANSLGLCLILYLTCFVISQVNKFSHVAICCDWNESCGWVTSLPSWKSLHFGNAIPSLCSAKGLQGRQIIYKGNVYKGKVITYCEVQNLRLHLIQFNPIV